MDHDSSEDSGLPIDGSPPSEAWLFAQVLFGKPLPRIVSPEAKARAKREELERLAPFSTLHAEELCRLQAAEAAARHDRELWEWCARISTQAEETLRAMQRKEAAEREAWRRAERFVKSRLAGMTEWNEIDHPRQPKGATDGGQWVAKGGGGASTGVPSGQDSSLGASSAEKKASKTEPGIGTKLLDAARYAGEILRAAAGGLVTGGKAVVNGSATAIRSVATLGLNTDELELIGVTKEDRANGYDTAVKFSTASGQVLIAVGTGLITSALSKGGSVARAASGALIAFDASGNAVGVVQGAYDASQNGINLENGLKIAGGSLGLIANANAARNLSRATAAAHLEKVDAYIAKCPRTPTPTKTAANQYEIAHTGHHNYTVSGGGAKFDIDGYQGTTILEAKHVGDVKSSPYVPGSTCFEAVRLDILNKTRDELRRMHKIIRSGETPFKSIEIITNTPESKALFESMLKELSIPGAVRLAI